MHSDKVSGTLDGSKERASASNTETQRVNLIVSGALAAELVSLNVDVIVTVDTPPTQAVFATARTFISGPTVMT